MKRFAILMMGLLVFTLGNAGLGLAENEGYKLPAVTGPYGIGTLVLPMVDERRPGDYADGSHTPGREMMTQIWYPADQGADGPKSIFVDELTANYEAKTSTSLKNFLLSVKTHAVVGAKVAAGREQFPLLIFSPGLGMYYSAYQTILEDLASCGYIVIGVNSPNIAGITAFPDGHSYLKTDFSRFHSEEEALKYLGEQLRVVADDLKFVINRLSMLSRNMNFPLAGRINFFRVGCFGHSFGGAVALQACIDSPWIAAATNLDGTLYGDDYKRMIYKPVMFVGSGPDTTWDICWNNLRGGSYLIQVEGSDHRSFSDTYLIVEACYNYDITPFEPKRVIQITRDCVKTFFNCHLKYAAPDRMNELAGKYEEIKLEAREY